MCRRQQSAITENSHKNGNDAEEDSMNKSKGHEWLLISGKLEALDSAMVHQDATIGITTCRGATSHLPPASIHGGAQKICSWFLSGPHSPLFLCCAN